MSEWQLIETAPRDGSDILAFGNGEHFVLYWSGSTWRLVEVKGGPIINIDEVTHWMPLPPPPNPNTTEQKGE